MQATPCSSYYTEVTSPHLRTPVHCLSGAVHCTGIVIPLLVTRFSVSWRVVSLAGTVPPILALLAISLTPESPAWLVMKDRLGAARRCLVRLRGPRYPGEVELEQLKQSHLYRDKEGGQQGVLARLPDPAVWKPFLIVNITFFIQNLSGYIPVRGYTLLVLQSTGSSLPPTDIALVSRVILALGHLASSLLLTRCGRRNVFMISCVGSALSLVGFGLSYSLHPASSTSIFGSSDLNTNITGGHSTGPPVSAYSPLLDWLPATSLCLWCLSYSLGLGPIPWAYSNELLPTDVRAQLYSLTACLVPLENFLTAKLLPAVVAGLGLPLTFFLFAGAAGAGAVWGGTVLPETRGLSLRQINRLFYSGRPGPQPVPAMPLVRSRTISEAG